MTTPPPTIDISAVPYRLVMRLATLANEAVLVPRPRDEHPRPPLLVESWRVDLRRDRLRELTGAGMYPEPEGTRPVCLVPVCVERHEGGYALGASGGARWIAWTELGWLRLGAHAWADEPGAERRLEDLGAWCDALQAALPRVMP